VENKRRRKKMRTKIIFFTAMMSLARAQAQDAVDNAVMNVDKHYFCQTETSKFHLVEKNESGALTYEGEDVYEGASLVLISKKQGVRSYQSVYQLQQGGTLTISESTIVGRGGDRAGRGGFDDGSPFSQKVISAKIVSYEKKYYFSCN
jgi:hypothetical protein